MKEALVQPGLVNVEIVDSPIPKPGDNEVLIKVVVSGSNPKDCVGKAVSHIFFHGQRVAAYHHYGKPHGSFAEHAIAPAVTTFAIPASVSYEEAAALPLAALTAALGLFSSLGLPEPWTLGAEDGKRQQLIGPLIVYGAASAIGAYAIQVAKRAGIGPLYCVAGRGIPFVERMLDKAAGDAAFIYRQGDDAIVESLKRSVHCQNPVYALDAVSEKGSVVNLGQVLGEGAKLTVLLPGPEFDGMPKYIEESLTRVDTIHERHTNFAHAWSQLLSKGLQEGWLKAHPTEVVPGGLHGVLRGLRNLKEGKASGTKYVFRIADTDGV